MDSNLQLQVNDGYFDGRRLDFERRTLKAVLQRLDALLQEVEASRKAFAKVAGTESFKSALDFLCSVQRGLKLPRNQTPYQLIRACFSD